MRLKNRKMWWHNYKLWDTDLLIAQRLPVPLNIINHSQVVHSEETYASLSSSYGKVAVLKKM